ncbi:isoprenylcysteine carboxylmethyltransferase family protein [Candidatus Thorarchaeota archaeon]|nr:MAG: isoprenylcysteine carboxylmethyltransferase family protein [Candidatus Thorarchaeota archaeon]
MSIWFSISLLGILAVIPFHFLSVEHSKLEGKYGADKGEKIGSILGMISGWGIFVFLIGLWISPQPQFLVPILQNIIFITPLLGLLVLQTPLVHLLVGIVFLMPGALFGIKGVTEIGLKESETHRPDKVITTGLYSRMRHPQYTGAILSHVGITFILSSFYSLLVTPLVIVVNYILCWKEEKELVREFGEEYEHYKKTVPMFIPRIRQTDKQQ